MRTAPPPETGPADGAGFWTIFAEFLRLGLSAFGGPTAHLAYFRDTFVLRRRWLDEHAYADLVALCQFLPGPASSQVGFALGVQRYGGLAGGVAAWCGFTLPAALALFACASVSALAGGPLAEGVLHGLKLVAVAIVAHAVWGMARQLTPDRPRRLIALAAMVVAVQFGGMSGQTAAIALGALLGWIVCRGNDARPTGGLHFPISRGAGLAALTLCIALPALLAAVAHPLTELFSAFYQAGALVFGGGHVVLPLLRAAVVDTGWVSSGDFLAGYGLTQAVPGPLFTFAAYLGALAAPAPTPVLGALAALLAIFLPGLLLVYGALPFWDGLRRHPAAQAAMRGTNAAVVGILALALYDPIWTSGVRSAADAALALAAFLLLNFARTPPWLIVLGLAAAGVAIG